ncbi:MAG: DUF1080 domain-containing protein, partial [Opitutae bacterium]|nr:DUF1080 domain-containing protein [Opitutae bacterium]
MKYLTYILVFILTFNLASAKEPGFTPIFDGKTLKGWEPMPGG